MLVYFSSLSALCIRFSSPPTADVQFCSKADKAVMFYYLKICQAMSSDTLSVIIPYGFIKYFRIPVITSSLGVCLKTPF